MSEPAPGPRALPGLGVVLVVDDNPATRYATGRVLQAAGFETREAGRGRDALRQAEAGIAAVILDIHLPDMNGFEVCRQLRSRPQMRTVPVIHLSAAYVEDRDKVRGLEGGADAYMTHPADPPLLVATVNALMRARRAEESMRRSEARFRGIYDLAPSGIALLDGAGRIADSNAALKAMLKRSAQAVVGRRLPDFAPEEERSRIEAHLLTAQQDGWRGEFPLVDADGGVIHLARSMSPHVEQGLVMAIGTNVSERVALSLQREELLVREQVARAAAERVGRAKGELIAVLSHELRTPLNAIMTWAQVLQRSTAQLDRGLEVILRNAKTQTRLISDILDMSRMDLGKLRLDVEPVDAKRLVQEAVEALGASIDDKSLRVEIDIPDPPPPLQVDAARLQQIVWNLMTNAVKFSEPGGRIWVRLRAAGANVELSVRDEGRGIGPAFLPEIFDRFSQSDAASNRLHGGLGLGLSIVRRLAELHGGSASAHSEGEGRGAEFRVVLPAAGPSGRRPEREDPTSMFDTLERSPGSLDGLAVLIVEDDPDARDITAMVLRDHGARVTVAHDADTALQRLAEEWPDAVVSDIGLPGRDGYALIGDIRRLQGAGRPPVRTVALTAFARAQDRDATLAAGFDSHCAKP
ncbi:MAG TPA: response regulator, partial [Caldimonas sp.]|nr:response regulator [Caldimonas sp.]